MNYLGRILEIHCQPIEKNFNFLENRSCATKPSTVAIGNEQRFFPPASAAACRGRVRSGVTCARAWGGWTVGVDAASGSGGDRDSFVAAGVASTTAYEWEGVIACSEEFCLSFEIEEAEQDEDSGAARC